MTWTRKSDLPRWWRRKDNERGATLIIVAIVMALLMPVALAFSVELGEETVVNRSLQAAADAGALDAARYIAISPSAVQAAGKNGVLTNYPGAGYLTTEGTWDTATTPPSFSAGCASSCDAVEVTASSSVQHLSQSGSQALSRSAVAITQPPSSEFSLGTSLASFQTGQIQIPVLNGLLSALGTSASVTAVGYNGLADTNLTVQQLIDASAGVLTPNNVLSTSSPALLPPEEWETILNAAVGEQAATLGCPNTTIPTCNAQAALVSLTPPTYGSCTSATVTTPAVTNISPNLGPSSGGTIVTISGSDLSGATAVDFGSVAATSITVNSTTSITATSPPGALGVVDVTVTTPDGTSPALFDDQFTYSNKALVSAITPNSGPTTGGTTVTITGANFTGATAVNFGNTAATGFTFTSSTSLTAVSPAGSAGTVDVTVTNAGGTSSTVAGDQFTYVAAPSISSITPIAGPTAGGTSVVISGSNLSGASAVSFGSSGAASFTVNSSSSITATSASAAVGTVNVTVTTAGGTSATGISDQFTYIGLPTVTAVTPGAGPLAGTSVAITGTNLSAVTAVYFGTTAATHFTVSSATSITATAPAEAAGSVDVTVASAGGTSATSTADQFTYTAAPAVSSISPNAGLAGSAGGGESVVITGANLSGATAVMFGSTAATAFIVNSGTKVTATDPIESAGTVNVTVTTPGGTSTTVAGDQFTYVNTPTVSSISPIDGPTAGSTSVTITGTNFSAGDASTAVTFGGLSGTHVTVVSSTDITVVTPADSAGPVSVFVSDEGGLVSAPTFTYEATPTISTLSPADGATAGGTTVTITGTGFVTTDTSTSVAFGGNAATSVTVVSSTRITATTPASTLSGGSGPVNVSVTDAGGTSGNLTFTYGAPKLTAVAPTAGPVAGGTNVTITGTGFVTSDSTTKVFFGSTAATNVTVVSSTQITATSPAGSAGTPSVTVSDTAGTSNGETYTFEAVPVISSIVSAGLTTATGSTAGGTSVTITGTGFVIGDTTTSVAFGTKAATNVVVVSATQITVTSPSGSAGSVNVTVTDAGGTSNSKTFTYGAPPTITSASGLDILGLSTITFTGTNLGGAVSIELGLSPGTIESDSSTTLVATTSQLLGILGSLTATITTPYGTATYGLSSLLSFTKSSSHSTPAQLDSDVVSSGPSGSTPITVVAVNAKGSLITTGSGGSHLSGAAVRLAEDTSSTSGTTTNSNANQSISLVDEDSSGAVACVSLCQFLSINGSTCTSSPSNPSALSADLNVLSSLTTIAELANGQNGLSVTSALNLPGVTANLITTLIQPPQVSFGPVGTTVSASQVNVELQLSISLVGLGIASVDIPLTGADGTATLESVNCNQNTMTSTAIQASTTFLTNSVTLSLLGSAPTLISTVEVDGAPATTLTFTNPPSPNQTVPPTAASEAAGTNPQTLGSPTVSFVGTSIPFLDDPLGIIAPILSALTPLLGSIIQPLGLSLSNATVTDLSTSCSPVELGQ
jgi:uncharacterized membrane protein